MRRALKGIVPTELLERKRKAFISRAPLSNLRDYQKLIEDLFSGSELAKGGFIYEETFKDELRNALAGQVTWISHLHQTISLELWLRSLFAYTLRRTA
jgi:asparagine synthase (glutamine-hydrolysing)